MSSPKASVTPFSRKEESQSTGRPQAASRSLSQVRYPISVIHKYIARSRQQYSVPRLYIQEIHALPPLELVGEALAQGYDPRPDFHLYIDEDLGPTVNQRSLICRKNLRSLYKDNIENVIVPVRVIQEVEYMQPEAIFANILNKPGVNPASRLYVVEAKQGVISSMYALTPEPYARVLRNRNLTPRYLYSATVSSFALAHHANLFSWLRFAGLGVRHLTIRALGTNLWDQYVFEGSLATRRALPLLCLLASIIAYKPYAVRSITLTGLGSFTAIIRDLWEAIPRRAPMTGEHPILDMLIAFPFEEYTNMPPKGVFNETGRTEARARCGNLFGLHSSLQWQAMIMKARHNVNDPQWYFLELLE